MKHQLLVTTLAMFFMCNVSANPVISSKLNYTHINMNNQLQQQSLLGHASVDLASLSTDVLQNNHTYLVDFSEVKSANNEKTKKKFYKSSAISLNSDRVFISRYENGLLYTPVDDNNFQAAQHELEKLASAENVGLSQVMNDSNPPIPMITTRIFVVRDILPHECTFPLGFNAEGVQLNETANFCKSPHMNLIYTVSLARSLPGSGNPDQKRVKISLSSESKGGGGAGNGIKLNSDFKLMVNRYTGLGMGGIDTWNKVYKTYAYSAVAQNYIFSIAASDKSSILAGGFPDNLDVNYRVQEVNTVTFGVTGKLGMSALNPTYGLDVTNSHSYQRWLNFDTQNYRLRRNDHGQYRAKFEWNREQYARANDILDYRTSTLFVIPNSVIKEENLTRMAPISYSQFVPNFMTTFIPESDNIKGTTTFNITSVVRIRPVYAFAIYQPLWMYYEGREYEELWKTVTDTKSFTVNWDHPVFLGGWPVTLQLQDFGGCVAVTSTAKINNTACNYKDVKQSLLYHKDSTYISVDNTSMCLDGADLTTLTECEKNRSSQKWEWKQINNNNYLFNKVGNKVLTYNKSDGRLLLINSLNEIPDGYSANIGTIFTAVINQ
jgi:hemolysin